MGIDPDFGKNITFDFGFLVNSFTMKGNGIQKLFKSNENVFD